MKQAETSSAASVKRVRTRGDGALTREQFLLREMRIVARLRREGASDAEILDCAETQNVFQYPTTRQATSKARTCLARLDAVGRDLCTLLAQGTFDQAAQIDLYAMTLVYRLVERFMAEEIAPRLAQLDCTLQRSDIGAFLTRYQDSYVEGAWSEATVKKIRSVLVAMLVGAGYLPSSGSTELRPIYLDPQVEHGIRANDDAAYLAILDPRFAGEGGVA